MGCHCHHKKSNQEIYHINQSIIGIVPIGQDSESLLNQLAHKEWYLPFLEKMSEHRRCEWLSVRILLKKLTGTEKEIRYHASGKPYLADQSYHIGISHTKGYVAVILSKEKEVAVDIEHISPRVEKIKERFISEEEERNLSKENELHHLLLHWSAKESLFKILDEENIEFKTQLHINPFEPEINTLAEFPACETRTAKQQKFVINYMITDNYVLTCIVSD